MNSFKAAESEFRGIPPWSQPMEEVPSLFQYLAATKREIRDAYHHRVMRGKGHLLFKDFWSERCEEMFNENGKQRDANAIASIFESRPLPDPVATQAISLAIYFWLESAHALDCLEDHEIAWAALTRCHFYLGMASGPETAKEMRGHSGLITSDGAYQTNVELLKILQGFSDNQFPHLQHAMAEIVPRLKSFVPVRVPKTPVRGRRNGIGKSTHGKSTNVSRMVHEARRSDPVIKAQFERIVARAIRRGRYPNS